MWKDRVFRMFVDKLLLLKIIVFIYIYSYISSHFKGNSHQLQVHPAGIPFYSSSKKNGNIKGRSRLSRETLEKRCRQVIRVLLCTGPEHQIFFRTVKD